MAGVLSVTLQLISAAIVLIILYTITLVILNIDSLITGVAITGKPKEKSMIIDGFSTAGSLANREFNTVNAFSTNFVKIPRSVNTHGGAQFTYSFWIKINEADDSYFRNLPIMIKGDKSLYNISLYPYNDPNGNTVAVKRLPSDAYIRCPLIKFGSSWRHLVVQFNTTNTPLTQVDIKMNPESGSTNRRNLLSLLPINWYMMTFVFEDNFSVSDASENGIKFSFYLNDTLYQSVNASTDMGLRNNTLRQNDGSLHLFPNPQFVNGDFMNVGNMCYYNYALRPEEVRRNFNAGPPKTMASLSRYGDIQPAHITAFNKLDIYNM
jgi:hypothetical protein